MCQNGVSHKARAKEVLLRYVIDRKFHPNNNGCSLCCGNDALKKDEEKSLILLLLQYNSVGESTYNKLILLANKTQHVKNILELSKGVIYLYGKKKS